MIKVIKAWFERRKEVKEKEIKSKEKTAANIEEAKNKMGEFIKKMGANGVEYERYNVTDDWFRCIFEYNNNKRFHIVIGLNLAPYRHVSQALYFNLYHDSSKTSKEICMGIKSQVDKYKFYLDDYLSSDTLMIKEMIVEDLVDYFTKLLIRLDEVDKRMLAINPIRIMEEDFKCILKK